MVLFGKIQIFQIYVHLFVVAVFRFCLQSECRMGFSCLPSPLRYIHRWCCPTSLILDWESFPTVLVSWWSPASARRTVVKMVLATLESPNRTRELVAPIFRRDISTAMGCFVEIFRRWQRMNSFRSVWRRYFFVVFPLASFSAPCYFPPRFWSCPAKPLPFCRLAKVMDWALDWDGS